MKSSLKKIVAATATLCALTLAPLAHAGLVTFDIKWANKYGVTAAFAELTLDSSLIKTSEFAPDPIDITQINSLNLTVNGAAVGNGVFTKKDFEGISFYTAGAMNFKKELIGQSLTVGSGPYAEEVIFGDQQGESGAFDLFALEYTTPSTVQPFGMATDRTAPMSDLLMVSSILARDSVSAVPEPETYAMLLAGRGLLAWRARRKA
jgi:hypothetical protein